MKSLAIIFAAVLMAGCSGMSMHSSGGGGQGNPVQSGNGPGTGPGGASGHSQRFPGMDWTFDPYFG